LVPAIDTLGQQKTKPIQQSIFFLRERGIFPDIIIGRAKELLGEKTKLKIHWLCNVDIDAIISDPNLESVYELPLIFEEENLRKVISRKLDIKVSKDLNMWKGLVNNIKNPKRELTIAICGKYTELADSYISIEEALGHAGAHLGAKIKVLWIETTDVEQGKVNLENIFKNVNGVIIPGGFGSRGVEGKIEVIKYAREHNIPYLGLCYGLQLAVVEFARNVCGLESANTTEADKKTPHPVIDILPEQKNIENKGGTMRLGSYKALLKKGSKVSKLYKSNVIFERHRHRYEVNPAYHEILQKNGLIFSGMSPNGRLVEFIELQKNKYFIATQAHPELKSRLLTPSPLFLGFIKSLF